MRVVVAADRQARRAGAWPPARAGCRCGRGRRGRCGSRRTAASRSARAARPARSPPAGRPAAAPGRSRSCARWSSRDVLKHLGRDHPVEAAVAANGMAVASPATGRARAAGRRLAGLGHGGGHGADRAQLALVGVEGDHVGAAPVAPRRHAARRRSPGRARRSPGPTGKRRKSTVSTARLPSARCGPGRRSVPATSGAGLARWAAIARSYSATVARATADQVNRSCTRCQAAAASRSRSAGESSRPRSAAASSSASPGVDQHGGVADHLGQRAGPAGDQRGSRGHVLDRGQREALVQRGHDGDLGAGRRARRARCR